MSYEHKDMTGTIFKNRHKAEGDNRPDYRGEIMVRGELLEIALWIKDGKNGGKFMSAKIQERREDHQNEKPKPQAPMRDYDKVPF